MIDMWIVAVYNITVSKVFCIDEDSVHIRSSWHRYDTRWDKTDPQATLGKSTLKLMVSLLFYLSFNNYFPVWTTQEKRVN